MRSKLLALILGATMAVGTISPTFCETPAPEEISINNDNAGTKSIPVSLDYTVSESYTVEVPAAISLTWNKTRSLFVGSGDVRIKGTVADGRAVVLADRPGAVANTGLYQIVPDGEMGIYPPKPTLTFTGTTNGTNTVNAKHFGFYDPDSFARNSRIYWHNADDVALNTTYNEANSSKSSNFCHIKTVDPNGYGDAATYYITVPKPSNKDTYSGSVTIYYQLADHSPQSLDNLRNVWNNVDLFSTYDGN